MGLDGGSEKGVDSAFGFVEAGPASSALVLAGGGGSSAVGATDGAVAFGGEGIGRNVVCLEIGLDLFFGPSGHGV